MSTNGETVDAYETPMDVCWQFDYAIDNENLKNLYSKSKKLQWDAERDIDWSLEIDPSKPIIEANQTGLKMERPPGQIHSFKDLMMPALVRVGAVTDRTHALFEDEGIPVWNDTSVLESMEDSETGEIDFDRS